MDVDEVIISQIVFSYLKPTIVLLRFFGLAPIKWRVEKDLIIVNKSIKYVVYSYSIAIILGTFSIFGLWCDTTAYGGVSFRVHQEIDVYINTFDIGIIILSILVSIFVSSFKVRDLLTILQCLNKIDTILERPVVTFERDRKISVMTIATTYVVLIPELIWDTIYHIRKANSDYWLGYLRNYGVVVMFYTVIFAQQLAYWNIVRFVKDRLEHMNLRMIMKETLIDQKCNSQGESRRYRPGNFFEKVDGKRRNGLFSLERSDLSLDSLQHLMTIHEEIYICVQSINRYFDLPVLFILINCLIEMVLNPWVLLTKEHVGKQERLIYVMWIIIHIAQLILLIEPTHKVLVENQRTNVLIVQLMKKTKNRQLRNEVELFAIQSQLCTVKFSTSDMIFLRRSVYAAITSAVTTYLVILIQFNK